MDEDNSYDVNLINNPLSIIEEKPEFNNLNFGNKNPK